MQLQEDILSRFRETVAVHPIERKPKPNLFNPWIQKVNIYNGLVAILVIKTETIESGPCTMSSDIMKLLRAQY